MNVKILASGSKGNCIYIQSRETSILIDAGLPKTKIEKRLLEEGIRPDEINAIFITHAHKDHVQGLPLANKYKIPVYASEGEWKNIRNVDEDCVNILDSNEMYTWYGNNGFDWLMVDFFNTHHDAYNPMGYTVTNDTGIKVSICLDTGKVDSEMLEAMKNSDIYIIEANHDPAILEVGDYPNSLKARILSDIGHLSNQQTAYALLRLVRGRGERIYLAHISSSNNLPTLARLEVKIALQKKGFIEGKHYHLEVV